MDLGSLVGVCAEYDGTYVRIGTWWGLGLSCGGRWGSGVAARHSAILRRPPLSTSSTSVHHIYPSYLTCFKTLLELPYRAARATVDLQSTVLYHAVHVYI